jgi:hypothetical protein
MSCGRCQAEDLHLFPILIGTLGRSGDEVTHFYDILTFLNIFLSKNFFKSIPASPGYLVVFKGQLLQSSLLHCFHLLLLSAH